MRRSGLFRQSGSRRLWLLSGAIAIVAASCSTADSEPATTVAPLATTSTTAAPTTIVPSNPGRLVITDDLGRVAVMDPDGSEAITLTEAGNGVYFQPTWSPDGNWIAVGRGEGDTTGLAVIDVADGSIDISASAFAPFYFSWSPDSSRVAYLANGAGGTLDMRIHRVAESEADLFGMGSPFYFAWAPDSRSLATHIGVDVMDVQTIDGSSRSLDPPGLFQAPQWTDVGVLHVRRQRNSQELVLTDGAAVVLGEVRGTVIFGATPDGSRIAMQTFSDQDGLSVARSAQAVAKLPANRLVVLDVATGEFETVSSVPVAAFFWSPDGSKLLVLGVGSRDLMLAWSVWDGSTVTDFENFIPTPGFLRNLVPFFDQYARSMTLWSPDGTRFAYPAITDDGAGIWVQEIGGGSADKITEGSWVSWSFR